MRKILGNKKGIQTILAALLMVVIVVVASVMVYAWSTGLLGSLLVTPTAGKENLTMDPNSYTFPTTTSVSLQIRNIGTVSAQLQTYYVKDSSTQNTWSNTNWAGGTINPNQVNATLISITTASGASCAPSPCSFTSFASGNSYVITVVTTRNNQFVFTVVK